VVKTAGIGAEIESATSKDTVEKVSLQAWVFGVERAEVLNIVGIQIRRPCSKTTCGENISQQGYIESRLCLPEAKPAIRIISVLLRRLAKTAALIAV
jgi:hypothetical protein